MTRFGVFVLIMLSLVPSARPAALYSVCGGDEYLREIDPVTGATLGSSAITAPGHAVYVGNGLAAHPMNGTLYAILTLDAYGPRWLATIDPATTEATVIGHTGEYISAIAFDTGGTLWGITGNDAEIRGALYEISTIDGSAQFQRFLGGIGWSSMGLAMNPDDAGLLYHAASGGATPASFEKIVDFSAVTYEDIPISSPFTDYVTEALTYWQQEGVFVCAKHWDPPHDFYHVTPNGTGTYIGTLDHKAKGLAFCSGNLYSVCRSDDKLRRIDPDTGATLSHITMTVPGGTIDDGAAGLAMHPVTLDLYALLGTDLCSYRTLVTVDPVTGVCTVVGCADDWLSGIAFDGACNLWGVTGDGADDPESLYHMSSFDASMEFFVSLGRGDDSESIAYNPDDGRLYHVSGYESNSVFERIIFSGTYRGTQPIPIGSPLTDDRCMSLTYWQDEDVFLWAQTKAPPQSLYRVTSGGDAVLTGQLDHKSRGLAFHEALQAVEKTSWGKIKNLYR